MDANSSSGPVEGDMEELDTHHWKEPKLLGKCLAFNTNQDIALHFWHISTIIKRTCSYTNVLKKKKFTAVLPETQNNPSVHQEKNKMCSTLTRIFL